MSLRFAPTPQHAALQAPALGETREPAAGAARKPSRADGLGERPSTSTTRFLEVTASALLLAVLLPLLALIAVLSTIGTGSSALIWRHRADAKGRLFRRYEFATLKSARDGEGRVLTIAQRSSQVGNILRRTGAHRLPQLINVLRGEMSFRDLGRSC